MSFISQGGFTAHIDRGTTDAAPHPDELLALGTQTPVWPTEMLGTVRTVTNLTLADAFVNTLSFIASMRQTGALLVVEPPNYICFGVEQGRITWAVSTDTFQHIASRTALDTTRDASINLFLRHWTVLNSEQQAEFIQFTTASIQDSISRLMNPVHGTAFWTEKGSTPIPALLDLPIDHLLLNTAKHLDEKPRHNVPKQAQIPMQTRLAFNLGMQLGHPIFKSLQHYFGPPPYHFTESAMHTYEKDAIDTLHIALAQDALLVQRDEDRTIPPKELHLWDTDKQALQLLVSRFNHILRRLSLLSGWQATDLNKQLEIFGQFYGHGSLLEGVSHLKDGAIMPAPLIQNALSDAQRELGQASLTLGNALQDLLFFNLSSAQALTATDRRALMAITSEITADLHSGPANVA